MASRCVFCGFVLVVVFLFLSASSCQSANTTDADTATASSLDSLIRDRALEMLPRRRTGVLYQVQLPGNLSGIEASVIWLRNGNFWSLGTNTSAFRIPPRVMTVPYVRRLVIISEDLGNSSSSYFNVPNQTLVAPVVGISAYDATNVSSDSGAELAFRTMGDPIEISFALPAGFNSTVKCVRFGGDSRSALLRDGVSSSPTSPHACLATGTGLFGIVVPTSPSAPATTKKETGRIRWWVWVVVGGGGVVCLIVMIVVVIGIMKLTRKKRREKMEKQADDGEALERVWVVRSNMPTAGMIRTQPVIECGFVP